MRPIWYDAVGESFSPSAFYCGCGDPLLQIVLSAEKDQKSGQQGHYRSGKCHPCLCQVNVGKIEGERPKRLVFQKSQRLFNQIPVF